MKSSGKAGFWALIVIGIMILLMLFLGQMMSFINYEFTVMLGLQESVDVIAEMGVAVNKGFGVGDTMIYIPLLILGIVGLLIRKGWGLITMGGALGITAYWPMTVLFILIFARGTPGFTFSNYTSYAILLSLISIYGIWGFVYLITRRKLLVRQ
jgi:hypothetical protein